MPSMGPLHEWIMRMVIANKLEPHFFPDVMVASTKPAWLTRCSMLRDII